MGFNSLEFFIFLPTVVFLYYFLPFRMRWIFLLIASYYFYMCWRPEYVLLIMASTVITYITGLQMGRFPDQKGRKKYLLLSLALNLSILFAFKYFNFFNDTFRSLFSYFNIFYGIKAFEVLLPVGISFYTFQALSYSIDVYRGKQEPEKHLGIFALYVSFFPQLVSGPIERSTHLLPQFFKKHDFDYQNVKNGILLMAWGFFKKVVIADRCAILVNQVYGNPTEYTGIPLIIATVFFAFQVYCDFSGYSDIAIGSAQVMGYKLMPNFNRPYFAKSITDLWRRWHISLATWIQDYLFTPLVIQVRNWGIWGVMYSLMISFSLIGLWHGANWNFILFGFLHGLYLSMELFTRAFSKKLSTSLPSWIFDSVSMFWTFMLWCFSLIFFRAHSVEDITYIITHLFNGIELKTSGYNMGLGPAETIMAIIFIVFLIIVQIFQGKIGLRDWIGQKPLWLRWSSYYLLAFLIIVFGRFETGLEFIYFQF